MIYFWINRALLNCSLNWFYKSLGISKQAFHQSRKRSIRYEAEVEDLIQLLHQIRADHPTMNCRDMYYKINPLFVGRDKFEGLCKECGFSVFRPKNLRRTTDSTGVVRFENLIIDLELNRINQVWSSDITYFEIEKVFYYITFILDNYSRRIIGHKVSSRLSTEHTSLPAIKMALKTREGQTLDGVIFHSDGGGQYYDKAFLALTNSHRFKNSMCEFAWENGKAERVNGVIKNNYLHPWGINSYEKLIKGVDRAVKLYNTDKPHSSLHRMTPLQFEAKMYTFRMQNRSKVIASIDEKSADTQGVNALRNQCKTGLRIQKSSLKKVIENAE